MLEGRGSILGAEGGVGNLASDLLVADEEVLCREWVGQIVHTDGCHQWACHCLCSVCIECVCWVGVSGM